MTKTNVYHPALALLVALSLALANWGAAPASAPQDQVDPPPTPLETPCELEADCLEPLAQYSAAPVAPTSTGGPDHFGYTWNDGATYQWEEISAKGTRIFNNPGGVDNAVQAVNLGFNFKFYEKTYSKVYISSNGLIGFDTSVEQSRASMMNLPVPLDFEQPQNFVAPFWANLIIGGPDHPNGKVFYYRGAGYFIAEWYKVSHALLADLLTFQVIFYQNGDIVFQYNQLTNPAFTATIGIEDMHGDDGLLYLYNSGMPYEGMALRFDRPAAAWRAKAFPNYQSGFSANGGALFKVAVRNTGEKGADLYNLQLELSDPTWQVKLYNPNGSPLKNTDTNPLLDTGSVAQGATFTVTVRMLVPAGQAGNVDASTILTLTAISKHDPTGIDPVKSTSVKLASAVPAPFAHMYREQGSGATGDTGGVFMEFVAPQQINRVLVNPNYTGATWGMNRVADDNYIGYWEQAWATSKTVVVNTNYQMLDQYGTPFSTIPLTLTNNMSVTLRDTRPVVVAAPNGKIGMAWLRTLVDVDNGSQFQENVYFAVWDAVPGASPVAGPVQVTSDSTWYSAAGFGAFSYPSIAVTGDNNFHLAWVETYSTTVQTDEIGTAVYNSSAGSVKAASRLTVQDLTGKINYSWPTLTAFATGDGAHPYRVLLQYFDAAEDIPGHTDQVVYALFNSDGTLANAGQWKTLLFNNAAGGMADGVQLDDGRILLVWKDLNVNQMQYALLGQDLSAPAQPTELTDPDGRTAAQVSVSSVTGGRALLTWMDGDFQQRMYYALVAGNGAAGILTWPMVFKYARAGGEVRMHTALAFGSAAYSPRWKFRLPLIFK